MKVSFSTFDELHQNPAPLRKSNLLITGLLMLFVFTGTLAQTVHTLPVTDISTINLDKWIPESSALAFAHQKPDTSNLTTLDFKTGYKEKVPASRINRKAVLLFNLINSSGNESSVYFYPGRYFPTMTIYKKTGNGSLERIPDILPDINGNLSYRKISLSAHESATFYVLIDQLKTYNNRIRPVLINKDYLNDFVLSEETGEPSIRMFSLVLCGLLLMMLVFSLINYSQGGNKEFLHYSLYVFFLGTLFLIRAFYGFKSTHFNFYYEGPLDFFLFCAGHLFYFLFIRRFLDAQLFYPFVNKICLTGIIGLLTAMVVYALLYYLSPGFLAEFYLENILKILLLVLALFFVFYARQRKDNKIFVYLAWGNGSLFVLSLISLLVIFNYETTKKFPGLLSNAVTYYQFGILLELVFFLTGLNYKNKKQLIEETKERERLKADNLMKEYEKELAVLKAQEEERSRISKDMHDELGSGMTAIRLMSELAKAKMKDNSPAEIDRISYSANDVLNKMNAIIWSMNSGNDTLGNLVSYIRSYAMEYFEVTPITCKVNIPDVIEEKELTGDKRRNVFLCVKETLNNALKHSDATLITIDIEISHQLVIRIHDNGKGIDLQKLRQFGNGLKNIENRMTGIGGSFSIENKNGTLTTLTLPL